MRLTLSTAILVLLYPAVVDAAGLASGKNFSVLTPAKPSQEAGDQYAQLVLHRAETFREQFAREWLGGELPSGEVRTVISVRFSEFENSGMTLAKDHPAHKFHNIFLASTPDNAAGGMLCHEIVHTVLATRYPHPNRLPPWAEEGIASRYDNEYLRGVRQQEVRSWARTNQFPRLVDLLTADDIASIDDTGYAAAESLVAYLLTRGDKQDLLRFADEGQRSGWDNALPTIYGIDGLGQLQREWQAWLAGTVR
jgi:hypothetical protein